ncbi:MAG: B12-binding domain-containing radical SAM protein [Candidatus Aureabacteria bacterium]|nr:B12-binding domain-containing radical SAM protein [Candidatus Auribacterota bacterium]
MKVLLIQPNNITYRGTICPPLAVMHVAGVTRQAGHEVKILDRNLDIWTLKKIKEFKPDLVGVTTFTGPMINDAMMVTKFVKKYVGKDVPVVWGGIHPSLLPEQTMEFADIDYIVRGEELAFPKLIEAIEGKRKIEDVEGIAYRKNGKTILTKEQSLIKNLDVLPMLPWDLVAAKKYLDLEIMLVTSRGCPFKCAFCYNEQFNKSKWRTFSVERIIKEIQACEKITKNRLIKLYDDNFMASKKRAYAILDYLSPEYSVWMEIRANTVNDDLLKRLRKFKRAWVLFGVETGSERLMKDMAKDLKISEIKKAFEKLRLEKNIFTCAQVIVDLPTETREEFQSTLDLLDSLDSTWPTIQAFMPFPGTRYYRQLEAEGADLPKSLEDWKEYAPDPGKTSLTGQKIRTYDPKLLKRLNLKYTIKMVINCALRGDIPKLIRRFRDYHVLLAWISNQIENKLYPVR